MSESDRGLQVNIVKEPRDSETEIRYSFSVKATSVTATAPDEYTLGIPEEQISKYFDPQSQQVALPVRIHDDAIIEGIETFQLELFVAEQPHFLLGSITMVMSLSL